MAGSAAFVRGDVDELRPHAAGKVDAAYALEVFAKDIYAVLCLMEYGVAEIAVCGTVAVGRIACPGCELGTIPLLDVVYFGPVSLIMVTYIRGYVGKLHALTGDAFEIAV